MNVQDKADPAAQAGTPAALPMVYVKAVDSSEVHGLDGVPAGTRLYAIFSAEGSPLAVLGNRDAAFYAAREHNMNPVSLH